MRTRSHYEVLGVAPTATTEEVEQAYKALLRQVHPDHAENERDRERRARESGRIAEAMHTLTDPVARHRYDAELVEAEARTTPSGADAPHTPEPDPAAPQGGFDPTAHGWHHEPPAADEAPPQDPPRPSPDARHRPTWATRSLWALLAAALAAVQLLVRVTGAHHTLVTERIEWDRLVSRTEEMLATSLELASDPAFFVAALVIAALLGAIVLAGTDPWAKALWVAGIVALVAVEVVLAGLMLLLEFLLLAAVILVVVVIGLFVLVFDS